MASSAMTSHMEGVRNLLYMGMLSTKKSDNIVKLPPQASNTLNEPAMNKGHLSLCFEMINPSTNKNITIAPT
ncbi:hypothetical protein DSECCO2_560950 [anaerobic digester metagenome]